MKFLLVAIGGAAGSLLRFIAATAIMNRYAGAFPLGTFLINVTGSFIIGFLLTIIETRAGLSPHWKPLLIIGFLGGYTTFSSFEWETLSLVRQDAFWVAVGYLMASVFCGFTAVWLGALLARR